MIEFAVAAGLFALLAALTLRLVRADAATGGRPRTLSALAIWLVYLFHADTVAAAAFTDVGRVDLPAGPFLVAGLTLALAGWLLFLAATITLVREGGFEGLRTSRAVFSGPFRFSRHPQNAGWAMLLLGVAIASRSVVALALVAVFAVFAARLSRVEELDLLRRFGTAYASYREATPVLFGLPRRRPRRAPSPS